MRALPLIEAAARAVWLKEPWRRRFRIPKLPLRPEKAGKLVLNLRLHVARDLSGNLGLMFGEREAYPLPRKRGCRVGHHDLLLQNHLLGLVRRGERRGHLSLSSLRDSAEREKKGLLGLRFGIKVKAQIIEPAMRVRLIRGPRARTLSGVRAPCEFRQVRRNIVVNLRVDDLMHPHREGVRDRMRNIASDARRAQHGRAETPAANSPATT